MTKENERYLAMHHMCGINKGDIVKVLRRAQGYEMGWDSFWTPYMDKFVGKECIVTSDNGVYGFLLQKSEYPLELHFPFFVLEKIKGENNENKKSI